MFSTLSKKYTPANFVFSVQFAEDADVKAVQETINEYLSLYSRFKLTGTRTPEDSILGWNLMGLSMETEFSVDHFLEDMSEHFNGIEGVSAIIFTTTSPRFYSTNCMNHLKRQALSRQCYAQLSKGINPNHSLAIN